jgi:Short C-terminal domain
MTEQPEDGAPSPAPDAAPATSVRAPHRHRILIGTLFVLATIIGFAAVHAVWINRQALNTDNWTNTSSQLLEDRQIQTAVAAYAVNQLFSSGIPQAELKAVLPTKLQALAGPISSGFQQLAGQVAPRVLASSQVQTAWREANRAAHATLIKIVNGGGSLASTRGGVVTLNLHAIIAQLAASLGVQQQVAAAQSKLQANQGTVQGAAKKLGITLPPSTGQLVIMRSNQLGTAQDIAGGAKGLALVLPLLAFALFILAVWLSRGHRQQALRMTGWCFAGIGLLVLIERRVAGNEVVNALVKNPSNKPAAHDAWTIATTLLYDIAVALVAYGLVFVVAAWLGGHTRPATALRRALAPTLRTRPAAAYITVYIALLLVVVWGPTPATRQIPYIIGFIVLIAIGVHVLRAQAAREYPNAQAGDTMRSIHAWNAQRRQPVAPAPMPVAAEHDGGRVAGLERLAQLHANGALTDAEFAAEKAVLLNGS